MDAATDAVERRKIMWEDQYQVFRRYGDGEYDLRASDMTIDDAVLFIKTIFQESFQEDTLRFEIRRQPMDYGKCLERREDE